MIFNKQAPFLRIGTHFAFLGSDCCITSGKKSINGEDFQLKGQVSLSSLLHKVRVNNEFIKTQINKLKPNDSLMRWV
jgi:hypothetical protein